MRRPTLRKVSGVVEVLTFKQTRGGSTPDESASGEIVISNRLRTSSVVGSSVVR